MCGCIHPLCFEQMIALLRLMLLYGLLLVSQFLLKAQCHGTSSTGVINIIKYGCITFCRLFRLMLHSFHILNYCNYEEPSRKKQCWNSASEISIISAYSDLVKRKEGSDNKWLQTHCQLHEMNENKTQSNATDSDKLKGGIHSWYLLYNNGFSCSSHSVHIV